MHYRLNGRLIALPTAAIHSTSSATWHVVHKGFRLSVQNLLVDLPGQTMIKAETSAHLWGVMSKATQPSEAQQSVKSIQAICCQLTRAALTQVSRHTVLPNLSVLIHALSVTYHSRKAGVIKITMHHHC